MTIGLILPAHTAQAVGSPPVNLVTNGAFAADSDWTKIGSASISGGVGNINATDDELRQAISAIDGDSYIVTLDIYFSGTWGNGLTIVLGAWDYGTHSASWNGGTLGTGWHTGLSATITNGTDHNYIIIVGGGPDLPILVDNVSVVHA